VREKKKVEVFIEDKVGKRN